MTKPEEISQRDYLPELKFTTSRSSGPGGQHVNKLETRVSLRFSVKNSSLLSDEEKQHLFAKWSERLTKEGEFIIHSEQFRSQLRNKEAVIVKFRKALKNAFTEPKPRKATRPTKASVKKRANDKRKLSEKKTMRRKPDLD